MSLPRVISWFSCGAASAIATKISLQMYKEKYPDHEFIIAGIYIEDEHPDSHRFLKECEQWFDQEIIILKNEKYNASVDQVVQKERYMSGPNGARCTKELKKQVRYDYQRHDDVHVFGMTVDEQHRIDRLIDQENDLLMWPILIDEWLSKEDCFALLESAGIRLPVMYQLGFNNNNCIGCLKAAGAGYWNLVRKHFPDVFNKRANQEKILNVALIKLGYKKLKRLHPEVITAIKDEEFETGREILKISKKGTCRVPLRFLPDNYGSQKSIYVGDCGFFCEK